MGIFHNLFGGKPKLTFEHPLLGTMTSLRVNGDNTVWSGLWSDRDHPINVYLHGTETSPSPASLSTFSEIAARFPELEEKAKSELLATMHNADPAYDTYRLDTELTMTTLDLSDPTPGNMELTYEQTIDPYYHFRVGFAGYEATSVAIDS